jgi:group I intron endonuclease
MKISGIYKIVNRANNKYYVGSSKDIEDRWIQHKADLRNNNHKNDYLQNAWNKHGENNFDFIIVEEIEPTKQKLLEVEQKYLNIVKTEKEKSYNLKFVAEGGDISDYSKNKISQFHKGRIVSEETKKKISGATKKAMNAPGMFDKMSKIRKGKPASKNWLSKIRDNTIYNFININTQEKFSGTRYEFRIKHNVDKASVRSLVLGQFKQIKRWKLDNELLSISVSGQS